MKQNKKDLPLIFSVTAVVFSAIALVLAVLRAMGTVTVGKKEPIHRSFQNDDVLRRGKYANRHTKWPL